MPILPQPMQRVLYELPETATDNISKRKTVKDMVETLELRIEERLKEMEETTACLESGCDPKSCNYEEDPWCPYMELKKLLEERS